MINGVHTFTLCNVLPLTCLLYWLLVLKVVTLLNVAEDSYRINNAHIYYVNE